MLNYIVENAKDNFLKIQRIITDSKTKTELVNKLRQEDVVIEEYEERINIIKDELKIVVDTKKGIIIKKVLVYNENYEEYVNLF